MSTTPSEDEFYSFDDISEPGSQDHGAALSSLDRTASSSFELNLEDEFDCLDSAKKAICRFALENNFAWQYEKTDARRYWVHCRGAKEGCPMKARVNRHVKRGVFILKPFVTRHTCAKTIHLQKSTASRSKWLAKEILPLVIDDPKTTPANIMNSTKRIFGESISYATGNL